MISVELKNKIDALSADQLRIEVQLGSKSRFQEEEFSYLKARLKNIDSSPQSLQIRKAKITIFGVEISIAYPVAISIIIISGAILLWWNWPKIMLRLNNEVQVTDNVQACSMEDPNQLHNCLVANLIDTLPPDKILIYPHAGNSCTTNPIFTNLEKTLHQRISLGRRNCQLQATRIVDNSGVRHDVVLQLDKVIATKSCDQGLPAINLTGKQGGIILRTAVGYLGEYKITYESEERRDSSLSRFREILHLCSSP